MDKIFLQLYSFEDGTERSQAEKLKLTKDMGFDGVELFGPYTEMPIDELKSLLETLGLEAISMHVQTDKVISKLPLAQALGIKYIGIGMETLLDKDAVYAYANKLNTIGQTLSKDGLMVTYHNHTQEFAEFDGERIIDILINNTNKDYVGFELDAGWCAAAGVDPVKFIEENAGRIKLIHLKESSEAIGPQPPFDFSKLETDPDGRPIFPQEVIDKFEAHKAINCPAGKGLVDWKILKEAADKQGCEAYIVERERTYEGTRLTCLEADIKYYRSI